MENFFIDIHCHPSMKPYGHSYKTSPGIQSGLSREKSSIWHYSPPNLIGRGLQLFTGISKFTQADATSLVYGRTQLVVASLYPIERGFFRNKLGEGVISDLAGSFITGVSKPRVDFVQNNSNYFQDVENEYQFFLQKNDQKVVSAHGTYRYHLVKGAKDLRDSMNTADENTVLFLFSIEGMHALNPDMDAPQDEQAFLQNVQAIKQWDYPPFFVTFAHHFYNHLCGHARSLFDFVGKETNQEEGIDTGFTPLGFKVLGSLLTPTNGKRIFIDIKHMSAQAREEYFEYLDQNHVNEIIPVIVSHGAANGRRSRKEPVTDAPYTAYKLLDKDINFYDNEIVRIAQSKGLFGLQLDERRIASAATLQTIRNGILMNEIRHYRAELIWNQVQHIVELLDRHELFAWDCLAIGSDFEGIINPLNGFLTEETMPELLSYLERYAYNYMQDRGSNVLKTYNQLSASEIVNRIFFANAYQFITKWLP